MCPSESYAHGSPKLGLLGKNKNTSWLSRAGMGEDGQRAERPPLDHPIAVFPALAPHSASCTLWNGFSSWR